MSARRQSFPLPDFHFQTLCFGPGKALENDHHQPRQAHVTHCSCRLMIQFGVEDINRHM